MYHSTFIQFVSKKIFFHINISICLYKTKNLFIQILGVVRRQLFIVPLEFGGCVFCTPCSHVRIQESFLALFMYILWIVKTCLFITVQGDLISLLSRCLCLTLSLKYKVCMAKCQRQVKPFLYPFHRLLVHQTICAYFFSRENFVYSCRYIIYGLNVLICVNELI